jgi:hypothetical protein
MTAEDVVSLWLEECRRGGGPPIRLADVATIRTGGDSA